MAIFHFYISYGIIIISSWSNQLNTQNPRSRGTIAFIVLLSSSSASCCTIIQVIFCNYSNVIELLYKWSVMFKGCCTVHTNYWKVKLNYMLLFMGQYKSDIVSYPHRLNFYVCLMSWNDFEYQFMSHQFHPLEENKVGKS